MIAMTKKIRMALETHFARSGNSAKELAGRLGVTEATMSRWRSGKQSVSARHWAKIKAELGNLISKADEMEAVEAYHGETRVVLPVSTKGERRVPILGNAQAAGYEPALEPLADWVAGFDDGDTAGWPEEEPYEPGFFCLRVEGESMLPDYPPGTILYVAAGRFPERGDIVVARLADCGEVVVKEYHRRDGVVELRSTNPAGKSYTVDTKAEPGRLVWMWPVLEARINLRRQRWERKK